ncbi:hypothetical protein D9M70_430710 [compost metagenome]
MTAEHLLAIRFVEPDVGHYRIGEAVACVLLMHPAGLHHLIAAVVFGLAMHGGQNSMRSAVSKIVLGQVIAPQRAVVAQEEVHIAGLLQPGITMTVQVPEMMVGVDQGDRRAAALLQAQTLVQTLQHYFTVPHADVAVRPARRQ